MLFACYREFIGITRQWTPTRYKRSGLRKIACFELSFLVFIVTRHQISGASPLRSAKNMQDNEWPREKKWRHLYTRSVKLRRAQQLGFEYPRLNERERLETEVLNVLFVCSMNKWRSNTAEKIYSKHPLLNTRSAGTSSKAKRKVSIADIRWSDLIILMEQKHLERIRAEFRQELKYSEMHVVEVEDRFEFMDPRLIEELQSNIDPILLIESS